MKVAITCLTALAVLLTTGTGVSAQNKVVCYYTNWSTYRQGVGKFTPADIDSRLCTHILYSFVIAENSEVKVHDKWIDVDNGYFKQVVAAKETNPEVKVMVAVGGWNNGGAPFSQMAKSSANRAKFIRSAISLIDQYNFDGFDLDWEYPGLRGGDANVDKNNFNLLIQELQVAFKKYGRQNGKSKPLLTAAVGPAAKTADIAYDKATICRELDFVNLMHYDIHGAWEKRTGFLAPMKSTPGEDTPENVLETMTQQWIDAGCSRDKLIFGMPMYGRGWTTSATTVHQPATGPSTRGRFTGEAGIMGYYEICEKLSSGWRQSYDNDAKQAIAYGEGQLVTYDNEKSIKAKVDYVKRMRLGGAMVWALDFDDFTGGFCNRGKYPLLTAINQQLGRGLPVTKPPPPPTTTDPSCTIWWCPSKTTTTTTTSRPRRRTTTTKSRRTTTQTPPTGGCQPKCNKSLSNGSKYLKDKCDEQKFYLCHHGKLVTFSCARGTKFNSKCSCCVHRR